MKEFQNKHITKALQIPKERFRSWIAAGYVMPSIQESSGRGVYNLFNRWDVYLVGLFVHLTKQGYGYRVASELVKGVRLIDESERSLADYIIIRFINTQNPFENDDYTQNFRAEFLLHNALEIFIDTAKGAVKRSGNAYCPISIAKTEVFPGVKGYSKNKKITPVEERRTFRVEDPDKAPCFEEVLVKNEFWTDLVHINFRRIKGNVDLALKRVESE